MARQLLSFLEQQVERGHSPVQIVSDARSRRFQVWLRTEEFVWLACRRTPRAAYRPVLFASRMEATGAAQLIEDKSRHVERIVIIPVR